jgi:hypothetical protein
MQSDLDMMSGAIRIDGIVFALCISRCGYRCHHCMEYVAVLLTSSTA